MQHIQGILELGTMQGSTGLLPDYGPTNIATASVPRWALGAAGNIRKEMQGVLSKTNMDTEVEYIRWRLNMSAVLCH